MAIFKHYKIGLGLIVLMLCFRLGAQAQKIDSIGHVKLSGYVDAYYAWYTDSVGANKFQKYSGGSPRSNSIGINIGQLTAQYAMDKIRCTATFHFGDIPRASWSPVYNYIQEANAGIQLYKKLWLDVGFFKTHIGTESLLPKDNIATSIAVITNYEPWWQAGAKFSYDFSEKLQSALYILNGYNQFTAANKKKAVGLVLNYALSNKLGLGYYNLLSDNTPDSISQSHWRFLHNLVLNCQLTEKLKLVLGMDYISQQRSKLSDSSQKASVNSLIFIANYKFNTHIGVYGRYESYNDPDGVLSGPFTNDNNHLTGIILHGVTLGVEYKPTSNSFIRLESRLLDNQKDQMIYYYNGSYSNQRFEIMTNTGIWF